ncbi:MAG TPA: hypothetical protein VHE99_12180 [Gammaproteobacteria bacterium]|nr:hypothetical protein [Gammaproteobacteria bacterium]
MPLNAFKVLKVLFILHASLINKISVYKESSAKDSGEESDLMQLNQFGLAPPPDFCAPKPTDNLLMEKCWTEDNPGEASGSLETFSSSDSKEKKPEAAPEPILVLAQSQALSEAIEKTKISINPDWYRKIISTPSNSILLISLEREIRQIRTLLSEAIHPKLLLDILHDPDFSIKLIAEDERGSQGYYSPIERTVYIRTHGRTSDEQLLATLRNELHHVAVHFTNLRRQGLFLPSKVLASMEIVRPFFQDSSQAETWEGDLTAYNAHKEALDAGFERIKHFKDLLSQSSLLNPNTFIDKLAKENLNTYLDAMKNYRLKSSIECLSLERINEEVLNDYSKSGNLKERAAEFIRQIEGYKIQIYKGAYRHLPLSEKELELSSYLQEIEPDILKVFFPEWCDYFSKYHKVEDYCLIDKQLPSP